MILAIDNLDSFTFNIVQAVQALGEDVVVRRSNNIGLSYIEKIRPRGIIISPGPGRPEVAGVSVDVIKAFYKRTPVLGVCLGHQCIAYAFGGRIIHAKEIRHGKLSFITHNGSRLFKGIPERFRAVRYHSLTVEGASLPDELRVCATSDDGEVMAIEHKGLPLYGLQFHPESIATPCGPDLIKNFIEVTRR
ncbi:MAG: aminodeoxychorismate/anthranilate synthase component II [Deltaproteobacteria bacterium]|nr:aminodeoxychorismate/anthranilate synthase component II [Deltaproteobacteria bacterium]